MDLIGWDVGACSDCESSSMDEHCFVSYNAGRYVSTEMIRKDLQVKTIADQPIGAPLVFRGR